MTVKAWSYLTVSCTSDWLPACLVSFCLPDCQPACMPVCLFYACIQTIYNICWKDMPVSLVLSTKMPEACRAGTFRKFQSSHSYMYSPSRRERRPGSTVVIWALTSGWVDMIYLQLELKVTSCWVAPTKLSLGGTGMSLTFFYSVKRRSGSVL